MLSIFPTQFQVTCTCHAGYADNAGSCLDINECDSDPCDPNDTCLNNDGGFECSKFNQFHFTTKSQQYYILSYLIYKNIIN